MIMKSECMDSTDRRLECNLNCKGGGICYSMKDLALKTLNSQSVRYDYSTPWDAMKMKGIPVEEFLL